MVMTAQLMAGGDILLRPVGTSQLLDVQRGCALWRTVCVCVCVCVFEEETIAGIMTTSCFFLFVFFENTI